MPKPIDPDIPLTPIIMARLSCLAPAALMALAFHGWVGFVWAIAGWQTAMASAATLIAVGAWCIACGPRFNRPVEGEGVDDRAAGRGEGL